MKFNKTVGLLAASLVLGFLCVALVVHPHPLNVALWVASAFSALAGIATINYKTPTTIAPTAADVYGLGVMTAQVVMGDTDTSAVVTHSFGLSAAELAGLFPLVAINPTAGGTVFPQFTIAKATDTVTLTKASTSGTGGTFDVIVMRLHTNQIGVNR